MSYFVCIVLSCLNIFLVCFLSPVPSGLFSRVVLSVLLVLLFPFLSQYVQGFSSILSFLLRFLIRVSSRNSHPGFEFLLVFWGEPPFFYRLISLPHRLVRLIPLCFSLRYVLKIHLFFFSFCLDYSLVLVYYYYYYYY